ncbi:MAG: omptin family outer membrane protease, partial [Treponema sp.]|nr:omptin family outer membrane protease [Treponema sp.]
SGELGFQISPLVWCSDLDEHLLPLPNAPNGRQFKDNLRWGLFLEPRGKIAFAPNQRLELSMELAYRLITGSRGEEYSRPKDTGDYVLVGEAGAGFSLLDTGLMLKVHF